MLRQAGCPGQARVRVVTALRVSLEVVVVLVRAAAVLLVVVLVEGHGGLLRYLVERVVVLLELAGGLVVRQAAALLVVAPAGPQAEGLILGRVRQYAPTDTTVQTHRCSICVAVGGGTCNRQYYTNRLRSIEWMRPCLENAPCVAEGALVPESSSSEE